MSILLPPGAHLPRAREALSEAVALLDRALEPTRRYRRDADEAQNNLKIAIAFHALAALDAAKAVNTISATDHAGTISTDYRTVFEALVKIRWMRAAPSRAKAYLESEPFERYRLATARIRSSSRWAAVVNDCKDAINRNPSLLKLPGAMNGKRPNLKAIAKALRFPPLEEMAGALGMTDDDVLIDLDVPSLTPHTSVVYVKNFPKSLNRDGTVNLSSEMDPMSLMGYVALTATRTGEVLQEVLAVWPDGALIYETELAAGRLVNFSLTIQGYMRERPDPSTFTPAAFGSTPTPFANLRQDDQS
jgi:hypothetical protein